VYARPKIDGEQATLGVSGMLWKDSLVMYDRKTRSLWSQVNGKAVAGPRAGEQLQQIPSEETTWKQWKTRHPNTLVLVKPPLDGSAYSRYEAAPDQIGVLGTKNPDKRLEGKELVFGMMTQNKAAAVPLSPLAQTQVLNAEISGRPIVVFSPSGERAVLAYERAVGARVLSFEPVSGEKDFAVRETSTGDRWSWEDGACLKGTCDGQKLRPIPGVSVYWGVWAQFHPGSAILGALQKPRQ